MNLVIRAHTLKTETLSQPITGQFDERGGTIGRSDTNTLALPDPERHISRLQAEIWFSEGSFAIRNVGSANSITLNGRPVNPGEGNVLSQGDELTIGAYVLRATISNASADAPPEDRFPTDARTVIKASSVESRTNPRLSIPQPLGNAAAPVPVPSPVAHPATPASALSSARAPATATASAPASTNPFADLLGGPSTPSANDPFAGLMGSPTPHRTTTEAYVRRSQSIPPITAAPPRPAAAPAWPDAGLATSPAPLARLPDDFDPFADLPALAAPSASTSEASLSAFMNNGPAAPPASALPADLGLGDLLGAAASSSGSSLDAAFGLSLPAVSGTDPLAAFLAAPAPGSKPGTTGSQDPLAMFDAPRSSSASAAPAIPADFNHTPEIQGAYRPPAVQPEPGLPPAAAAASTLPLPAALRSPPSPPPARPSPPQTHATTPPLTQSAATVIRPLRKADDLTPLTTMPGVRPVREAFESDAMPFDALPPAATVTRTTTPALTPPPPPAPARPRPEPHAAAQATPAAAGSATAATAAGEATPEALWAAFCEGAGISLKLPQGLTPELMRVIGQVLHHSVDGTIKMVAVRAAAKQELRADVTTIQARNNNPLKFSPDAGVAIEQLLQPPMRGFMMGPAAVNDVMDDLLGHAIGTMAGMRAALTGVLERFEPKQLEGKLASNSVLDAVLPMNRRAKLWELYLQHYQRIRDDAQDDFHDLFGRAFIEAYEEQLDRLDAARHPT